MDKKALKRFAGKMDKLNAKAAELQHMRMAILFGGIATGALVGFIVRRDKIGAAGGAIVGGGVGYVAGTAVAYTKFITS